MALLPLLALLPFGQDPEAAAAPKFVWPPAGSATAEGTSAPQRYTARLRKERRLSPELADAERKARAASSLPPPPRSLRQSVEIEIGIEVRAGVEDVTASYAVRVPKAPELRLQLLSAKAATPADAAAPRNLFANAHQAAVWGHPDQKNAPLLAVPSGALECTFEQRFARDDAGGVDRADLSAHVGDHLLPVLWDELLPCWLPHAVDVVELAGQAAIEGKKLIRDGSGSFPLGHRDTRVELEFVRATADGFSFRYRATVRQQVARSRDLQRAAETPFTWVVEVEGEADYSATDQAFDRIRETVRAAPGDPDEALAARLRDESYAGTIAIERIRDQRPPKKRGR